jgi:hypothetical protein
MAKNRVKKHEAKCECSVCDSGLPHEEAMEKMRRVSAEMLAEHGWYAHFVTDEDKDSPTGYNMHTHGLDLVGGMDFQVVLPINPKHAHAIMGELARRTLEGERFEPGQEVAKAIAPPYALKLVLAKEGDRNVLRLIFPDADNKFFEAAAEPYSLQHVGCLNAG